MLAAANADNDDGANSKNNIFTVKCKKSYIPVVILTAKDNPKLPKFLVKNLKDQYKYIGIKIKQKLKIKMWQMIVDIIKLCKG